jgi:hypothetical protein
MTQVAHATTSRLSIEVKAAKSRGFKLQKDHERALLDCLSECGLTGRFVFYAGDGKVPSTTINGVKVGKFDAGRRCMQVNVKGDGPNQRQIQGWLYVPATYDPAEAYELLCNWQAEKQSPKTPERFETVEVKAESVAEVKDMVEMTMPNVHTLLQDNELVVILLTELFDKSDPDANGYMPYENCEGIICAITDGISREQIPTVLEILVHQQKVLELRGTGNDRRVKITKTGRTLITHHTTPRVKIEQPKITVPSKKKVVGTVSAPVQAAPTVAPIVSAPVGVGHSSVDQIAVLKRRVQLAGDLERQISRQQAQINEHEQEILTLSNRIETLRVNAARISGQIEVDKQEMESFASDIRAYEEICKLING